MFRRKHFALLLGFIISVLSFQNCSNGGFQTMSSLAPGTYLGPNSLTLSDPQFPSDINSDAALTSALGRLAKRGISFGYFGSAYGTLSEVASQKDRSNFVFIADDWRSNNEATQQNSVNFIQSALANASQLNLKAVIGVFNFFYQHTGDGSTSAWRNSYDSEWALLKPVLAQYQNSIAALYIDEPYLLGSNSGRSVYQTHYELETMAQRIKKDFPQIKLMMVEAVSQLGPEIPFPESFDIFGFDCYDGFDKCGPGMTHSVVDYHNMIKNQLAALNKISNRARSIVLVPPVGSSTSSPLSETDLIHINASYLKLADSDSDVSMIMPFIWQGQSIGWTGVKVLPVLGKFMDQVFNISFSPAAVTAATSSSTTPSTATPAPAPSSSSNVAIQTPVVTTSGLGCADNMCIWFGVDKVESTIKVQFVDPANYGTTFDIPSSQIASSTDAGKSYRSFRVPDAAIAIFKARGGRIVVQNVYPNNVLSDMAVFTQGAPPSSNVSSVPAPAPAPAPTPTPTSPVSVQTPVVTVSGLGCNDNMCIWFGVTNVESTIKVQFVDPANYGTTFDIPSSQIASSTDAGKSYRSFRVPDAAIAIFKARGGRIIVQNVYPNNVLSNMAVFTQGAPPSSNVSSAPAPAPAATIQTPVVNQSGLGCSDNMCIWFAVDKVESMIKIQFVDPANFGTTFDIPSSQIASSTDGGKSFRSFRVPDAAIAIFKSRGGRIVVQNVYPNNVLSDMAVFTMSKP